MFYEDLALLADVLPTQKTHQSHEEITEVLSKDKSIESPAFWSQQNLIEVDEADFFEKYKDVKKRKRKDGPR